MSELRRSFAMSHLPFTYDLHGWIKPFVIGKDDASGDTIADITSFSETRGNYWLWKNGKFAADEFVAINQYRRCFWFPQLVHKLRYFSDLNRLISVNAQQPTFLVTRSDYIAYIDAIQDADLSPLNEWLSGSDLVVNRSLLFDVQVCELYGHNHRSQDWQIFAHVLRKHGYNDGRFNWLATHTVYIFTPELFNDYMTDWWQVVSEVRGIVEDDDDPYQHRKFGFMSEWFMSMWLIKLRVERPTVRVQTLPILEGRFELDREPGKM
jgi:uncharacterized protein DUF4422